MHWGCERCVPCKCMLCRFIGLHPDLQAANSLRMHASECHSKRRYRLRTWLLAAAASVGSAAAAAANSLAAPVIANGGQCYESSMRWGKHV